MKLLASLASANHQTYQDVTTVYDHLAANGVFIVCLKFNNLSFESRLTLSLEP